MYGFIMFFVCQYLTFSFVCFSVGAGFEIIWHVCISIMCICFICLGLWALFVLQLGPLDASIFCESNFLVSWGSPIT